MNGVKLSTLRYIEVDVEGRQCMGLVDSGAEICLISQELASEIHADECGHIGVRGIFSDPIRLQLISVNIKGAGETTMIMLPTACKSCVPLPH